MTKTRPAVELTGRWKGEQRDCTVRSFAVAFGIPYELAHEFIQAHGRKNKHRFNLRPLLAATVAVKVVLHPRLIGDLSLLDQDWNYLVFVRGHSLGWSDGFHSDLTFEPIKPNQRIKELWKVPKRSASQFTKEKSI